MCRDLLSDPKSARGQASKPVTLNTQAETTPMSARVHAQPEFSYKYEYPENLNQAHRLPAGKKSQDGDQSSNSESSESEEEDCPDFFSNQEFLQTSSQQANFKEGRVQIEGGSVFARREYKHNDDLVEELLESCKSQEKSLTERINQRKSDLRAIQESKSKEEHALKALQ